MCTLDVNHHPKKIQQKTHLLSQNETMVRSTSHHTLESGDIGTGGPEIAREVESVSSSTLVSTHGGMGQLIVIHEK